MLIFVLGIDLGKNVCSLVGLDEAGAVVLRRWKPAAVLIIWAACSVRLVTRSG
jgi:hypothetical protein